MKILIPFLFISSAFAANLEVSDYDQARMAYFLNKLPAHVVEKDEDSLSGPRKVRVVFPKKSDILHIECVSEFYDSAPVPSFSTCSVEIEINHQSIEKKYDEVRFTDDNADNAKALFAIMREGKDKKYFRSGEFEDGTDFNGRRTNIFSFLFECTEASCLYRFSEKMIK